MTEKTEALRRKAIIDQVDAKLLPVIDALRKQGYIISVVEDHGDRDRLQWTIRLYPVGVAG